MFTRARPRMAVVIAWVGGLIVGLGTATALGDPLDLFPAYAVASVGAALWALGVTYAWPRQADTERYVREAKEQLMRERARRLETDTRPKPSAPGRPSANSQAFVQPEDGPSTDPETARVRAQLRDVQKRMQEAAVRLGLKQISKEGYTVVVSDLQLERTRLEARLMEFERRAIGRS